MVLFRLLRHTLIWILILSVKSSFPSYLASKYKTMKSLSGRYLNNPSFSTLIPIQNLSIARSKLRQGMLREAKRKTRRKDEINDCNFTPDVLNFNVDLIWKKWSCGELNPRPLECKSSALPTELQPQVLFILHWSLTLQFQIPATTHIKKYLLVCFVLRQYIL